jgi:hypothetical protein
MIYNFIEEIESSNTLPTIKSTLQQLEQTSKWTQQHHKILEDIDQQFTNVLLNAEQAIAIPIQHPWSINFDVASSLYSYWLLKVIGNQNNIIVSKQLETIASKLNNIDIYHQDKNRRPLLQMRLARKTLINCRIESESNRNKQINIQHDILIQQGKMALADALRLKITREQQRKCWKMLRNIIHCDKTTGGISHVLIPPPTNQMPNKPPSRIQGKNDLDPTQLN